MATQIPQQNGLAFTMDKKEGAPEKMKLKELVLRNRSYRRFNQEDSIDLETLKDLVDLARLSASEANLQPLKYVLSCDAKKNASIFPHLMWAGYLKDWSGPSEGERPSAYIIVLGDTIIRQSFGCDQGTTGSK